MLRLSLKSLALVLMLYVGLGNLVDAASFDCSKATTETEIAICNDPELSALDDLLALTWAKYKERIFEYSQIKSGSLTDDPPTTSEDAGVIQMNWINNRNQCAQDLACIKNISKNRIIEMSETHFEGSGNTGTSYYRKYFKKTEQDCMPSELSVDAFFDKDLNLCYEIVPNIRFSEFLITDGHMWVSYYELSPGYFDCQFAAIYQKIENNAKNNWRIIRLYFGPFALGEVANKRENFSHNEYLTFSLGDGLVFSGHRICGNKNLGLGGLGFGR